jgi:hypothetical protein
LRIGSQIARGLAAAHATGLIHRDVKPSNILLENGVERVKITDFGLARAADDASISHSGMVAGTPMYMSPEQARGEKVDPRSDLFSLGSVLYAMLTGRAPFRAGTTLAVLKRVAEVDPRAIREINPEVPEWLTDVVARLHAKDPAGRFPSAREVAEFLTRYQGEWQATGSVTVAEARPAEPEAATGPRRRVPRRRWKRAVAAGVGLLVLAGILLVVGKQQRWWDPRWRVGEVVIGIHDPDVQVMVGGDGPDWPYHPIRGTGFHRVRLYAGEHDLWASKSIRGELLSQWMKVKVDPSFAQIVNLHPEEFRPQTYGTGWVPLYNGKDLTGWSEAGNIRGLWQGDRGSLRGSGAAGLLVSDREFSDFRLWCICRVNPGGTSGILYRFDPARPGAYEARIGAGGPAGARTGTLTDPCGRTLSAVDAGVKPGELFSYEVVARGDRHQLRVNGKLVLDWLDVDHQRARGHIALRLGDPNTVAGFDVVDIEEQAPDTMSDPVPPEELNRVRVTGEPGRIGRTAQGFAAADGFTPLFNGKDLSEWRVVGDPRNSWQVRDGHIWGGGAETFLVSMQTFQNFHLRAEARISPGGSGSILFRAAPSDIEFKKREFHPDGFEVKSSVLDAGGLRGLDVNLSVDWLPKGGYSDVGRFQADQWVSLDLVVLGDKITATIGDRKIETTDPDRRLRAGPIMIRLGSRDTVLEFRKIEVKELPAAGAGREPH